MTVTVIDIPKQNAHVMDRDSPELMSKPWWVALKSLPAAIIALAGICQSGTHAARLALSISTVPDGALYVESDRNGLVYQLQGAAWAYVSGVWSIVQADAVATIADLVAADIGLLLYISDFDHTLICTAAATTDWAPGDMRPGQLGNFDADPGLGWKLIDGLGDDGSPIGAGHPIKILKADGTTRDNITAADMTGGVYARGAAAYDGAVTAATDPTGSGTTGSTAPGNTSAPNAGGTILVGAGAGTVVASAGHVHTEAAHTHTIGAITLGGDPVAFTEWLPYLRK